MLTPRRSLLAALALVLSQNTAVGQAVDGDGWLDRANSLRRAGQDAEALALLRRVHARAPSIPSLAQVALAEQAVGAWVAAAEHLDAALASADPWVEARRAVLREARVEVGRHLGSMHVVCDREGAWLRLDAGPRRPVPSSPVTVVAGTVVVEVGAPGHHSIRRELEVDAGGLARERFDLVRDAPRDASRSAPSAPAGDLTIDPAPTRGSPILGWALAGVGLAAAAAGGASVWVRNDAVRDYNSTRCAAVDGLSRDDECPGLRPRWRLAAGVGGALLAMSGVLLSVGLTLAIRGRRLELGMSARELRLRLRF